MQRLITTNKKEKYRQYAEEKDKELRRLKIGNEKERNYFAE